MKKVGQSEGDWGRQVLAGLAVETFDVRVELSADARDDLVRMASEYIKRVEAPPPPCTHERTEFTETLRAALRWVKGTRTGWTRAYLEQMLQECIDVAGPSWPKCAHAGLLTEAELFLRVMGLNHPHVASLAKDIRAALAIPADDAQPKCLTCGKPVPSSELRYYLKAQHPKRLGMYCDCLPPALVQTHTCAPEPHGGSNVDEQ